MTDTVIIVLVALGVFATGCVYALIRVLMDGRRMRRKLHERRVDDAEREALFWEKRYGELIEVISARTDQAAGEKR